MKEIKIKGVFWFIRYITIQCYQRIRLRFSNIGVRTYPPNTRVKSTVYPVENYETLGSKDLYDLRSKHYQKIGVVPSSLAKNQ